VPGGGEERIAKDLGGSDLSRPRARAAPPGAGAPGAPSPEPDPTSYRVWVRAVASPRTRTLTIEADSLDAARGEALRYTGEGWRVVDVETL
jgi:hypothetical protein